MSYNHMIGVARNELQREMQNIVDAKSISKRAEHVERAEYLEATIKDWEHQQLQDMARDIEPSRRNDTRLLLVKR